jgi:hypothetical protein
MTDIRNVTTEQNSKANNPNTSSPQRPQRKIGDTEENRDAQRILLIACRFKRADGVDVNGDFVADAQE